MPLHFYLIEAEMTQQNAQSTSEPTISENDLIAQRYAKLQQILLSVNITQLIYKNNLKISRKNKLKALSMSM
jgi:hypothetical protein